MVLTGCLDQQKIREEKRQEEKMEGRVSFHRFGSREKNEGKKRSAGGAQ